MNTRLAIILIGIRIMCSIEFNRGRGCLPFVVKFKLD